MTILDEIMARKRSEVAERKLQLPEERLYRQAVSMTPALDFAAALRPLPSGIPRVIAEIKKASPSKGVIRKNFPVVALARALEKNGAAALSVLTDEHYFQGSLRNLQLARSNVRIPILRKDFICDPYQIYEARAYGADAVLLIAAALSATELNRLKQVADEVGLAVLAEVHNQEELDLVVATGAAVIGVNSRNLKTFETDLATTERLLQQIPAGTVKVAESGIHSAADIQRLQAVGAEAFLIGESLMRERSPGKKLRELLGK